MGSKKVGISIFVHCNPLNLQALKFYFCALWLIAAISLFNRHSGLLG